jgi:hypothetical protein
MGNKNGYELTAIRQAEDKKKNYPTWDELKAQGSEHYKNDGGIEPIDLYLAMGMFRHFACCSIIKYAIRNRHVDEPVSVKDMNKIIDYAQKLIASCRATDTPPRQENGK